MYPKNLSGTIGICRWRSCDSRGRTRGARTSPSRPSTGTRCSRRLSGATSRRPTPRARGEPIAALEHGGQKSKIYCPQKSHGYVGYVQERRYARKKSQRGRNNHGSGRFASSSLRLRFTAPAGTMTSASLLPKTSSFGNPRIVSGRGQRRVSVAGPNDRGKTPL